jgi:hypothetical protein
MRLLRYHPPVTCRIQPCQPGPSPSPASRSQRLTGMPKPVLGRLMSEGGSGRNGAWPAASCRVLPRTAATAAATPFTTRPKSWVHCSTRHGHGAKNPVIASNAKQSTQPTYRRIHQLAPMANSGLPRRLPPPRNDETNTPSWRETRSNPGTTTGTRANHGAIHSVSTESYHLDDPHRTRSRQGRCHITLSTNN